MQKQSLIFQRRWGFFCGVSRLVVTGKGGGKIDLARMKMSGERIICGLIGKKGFGGVGQS